MKKTVIFTILFLCLSYLTAFSQSEKNDLKITIAGLPLFGSSNESYSGLNGYVLKPSVGYYISKKTSIELNFSYAYLNNLKVATFDSYYRSYAITPVLRNNLINKKNIRLFAEVGFGLGTIKYTPNNNDIQNIAFDNLSGGISIFNIGIGGNYYFSEKIGLELIIPYISSANITSKKSANLYRGIGPTIGVTFQIN